MKIVLFDIMLAIFLFIVVLMIKNILITLPIMLITSFLFVKGCYGLSYKELLQLIKEGK